MTRLYPLVLSFILTTLRPSACYVWVYRRCEHFSNSATCRCRQANATSIASSHRLQVGIPSHCQAGYNHGKHYYIATLIPVDPCHPDYDENKRSAESETSQSSSTSGDDLLFDSYQPYVFGHCMKSSLAPSILDPWAQVDPSCHP